MSDDGTLALVAMSVPTVFGVGNSVRESRLYDGAEAPTFNGMDMNDLGIVIAVLLAFLIVCGLPLLAAWQIFG